MDKNIKLNFMITKCLSFLFMLLFFGCDSTEPNSTSLSLSLKSESSLPKVSEIDFQLNEVKLLLRNIKIKHQANENEPQIKTGPMVVKLNLNGNTTEFTNSEIPAGSYNRVRFEIHKIEDSEKCPDPEFKEGAESSKRYSIIVNGSLNGEEFTYRSRKSAEQDIKLSEDLLVEENEEANITITVDPYEWFYDGDTFLNPNDETNEAKIDNNLKNAFKNAYRDNNNDGISD